VKLSFIEDVPLQIDSQNCATEEAREQGREYRRIFYAEQGERAH